jgi:transcriptional regulator with XRE-family HTH domain
MPTNTPTVSIGLRVRELRKERRLTQARLAALLHVTQGHLSQLEHGNRSFSAEQLLIILKHFNVPIDIFEQRKSNIGSQIQSALARQGATHLYESGEVLPSDRLKSAIAAIREALVSGESARQIAAIAPVLVAHAGQINLARLRTEFAELGLENRFNWAIDSTLEALKKESATQTLSRKWALKYRRATIIIESFFSPTYGPAGAVFDAEHPTPHDILDLDITSPETLKEVTDNLSPIARRWRVVTEIEVDDFVRALRGSRDSD